MFHRNPLVRASLLPLLAFLTLLVVVGGARAQGAGSAFHLFINLPMTFDGVNDYLDLGSAAEDGLFISDYAVRFVFDLSGSAPTQTIVSNLSLGVDGLTANLVLQGSGAYKLFVSNRHSTTIGTVRCDHVFPVDEAGGEVVFTEEFTVNGSDTEYTMTLWVDGVQVDQDSSSVPTVELVSSPNVMTAGAFYNELTASYQWFFEGTISQFTVAEM